MGTEDQRILPIGLNNSGRWEIATEYLSNGGILDQGKLDAKTDDNTHDQCHDEHLKEPEALNGAIRVIEEKDDENIHDANCASSHEGNM